MKFVANYIKNSSQPIHLVKCKDEEGIDCFYFLMCAEHKLGLMKSADEEIVDLNNYGVIVHSGYGLEPKESDLEIVKNLSSY